MSDCSDPSGQSPWTANVCHNHAFGQHRKRPGETRTLFVIAIAAVMMVVEIAAGWLSGSMALLADGLHMGAHVAALGVSAFAYIYARRYAFDRRYSFGTGKVSSLAGFSGAILLLVFAIGMAWESIERLFHQSRIAFDQAIFVAVVGLAVNGLSAVILGFGGHSHDSDEHGDEEGEGSRCGQPDHDVCPGGTHAGHRHGDHNLKSAFLHVAADALTSVLAIAALLAGKFAGLVWLDPVIGIAGAVLVGHWSIGLIRDSSAVLLDRQGPAALEQAIRSALEGPGDCRVVDLHLWSVGPRLYALVLGLVADEPLSPEDYKRRLPAAAGLAHVTVEVHRTASGAA